MNKLIDLSSELGVWLVEELEIISATTKSFIENDHDAVNNVCDEVFAYQGKLLRPSLLMLSWRCADVTARGDVGRARCAAAVMELIHLATLVHDDVLDDALLRRGGKTMNCLHGNEAAVMLGDYLLSSAFHLCSTIGIPNLNVRLGEVTRTVCVGELMQLHNRNNFSLTLEQYYEIIRGKTASLIAACCEIGGVLGGDTPDENLSLRTFGENVGMAFQIRDDLLDLQGEQSVIGKPAGRDLQKGKLTLPVILLIKQYGTSNNQAILAIQNRDHAELSKLINQSGVIDETRDEINRLVDTSVLAINNCFSSESATQLCALANQLKQPF